MTSDLLLTMTRQLLEQEWRKRNLSQADLPSHRLVRDLVEMIAENPARQAHELEHIVQRMLVENQFVDDTGDSMVLGACDTAECQAHALIDVLEEVRTQALHSGIWSTEPVTPMMFG